MTKIRIIVFLIALFTYTGVAAQQKTDSKHKLKKRSKQITKKREQDRQAEINMAEDLKNQHQANQTKAIRKRMKKNRKRAKRHNNNRRKLFFVRWWEKSAAYFNRWF